MNIGVSVPLPAYNVDVAFMSRSAETRGFESKSGHGRVKPDHAPARRIDGSTMTPSMTTGVRSRKMLQFRMGMSKWQPECRPAAWLGPVEKRKLPSNTRPSRPMAALP